MDDLISCDHEHKKIYFARGLGVNECPLCTKGEGRIPDLETELEEAEANSTKHYENLQDFEEQMEAFAGLLADYAYDGKTNPEIGQELLKSIIDVRKEF